jgi:hypothetical protein
MHWYGLLSRVLYCQVTLLACQYCVSSVHKYRFIAVSLDVAFDIAYAAAVGKICELWVVENGRPFWYWQMMNISAAFIDNIAQSWWLIACNIHTNLIVTCTVTENQGSKAILVTVILCGLHTDYSELNAFSIVVKIAMSWRLFNGKLQGTGLSASLHSQRVTSAHSWSCLFLRLCISKKGANTAVS